MNAAFALLFLPPLVVDSAVPRDQEPPVSRALESFEPQSAREALSLVEGVLVELARSRGGTLGGALANAGAPGGVESAPEVFVAHRAEAEFRAGNEKRGASVELVLDLEVRAEDAIAATRLYERLRSRLEEEPWFVSADARKIEESDDGRGMRVRKLPLVVDLARVERPRGAAGTEEGDEPALVLIRMASAREGRERLGPIDITTRRRVFADGSSMETYQVRAKGAQDGFELASLRSFASDLEDGGLIVVAWVLERAPTGSGWRLELTAARLGDD